MLRLLSVLLALAACAHASSPAHPTESLPLDYFIANPSYRIPRLAPDGTRYSIVISSATTDTLATIDLATGKTTPVMKSGDARILNSWWKGQDRILLLVRRPDGDTEFHTFALNTSETEQDPSLREWIIMLVNPLHDDPDHVLIASPHRNFFEYPLQKFNVRTGHADSLPFESNNVVRWFTNDSGQPLANLAHFHEEWFMRLTGAAGQPWRRVSLGEKSRPDFIPWTVAPDQRRLIGLDVSSADTARVVAWDPANDTKEVLCESSALDPRPVNAWSEDWTRMLAVVYEGARPNLRYFDSEIQTVADAIDQILPNTTNEILSTSVDKSRMIVSSTSDQVSGNFYLFDRNAKRLIKLGAAYPGAEPARMAPSRYFTFPARDGLMLHGRILLPPGLSGPLPAVVVIDDLREPSHFRYDPFRQLLASRGYAVIEIDHRGTAGYGEKFAALGDLQIAGNIPADIADAVAWLAEEHLVDPRRVALHGMNHGGLIAFQTMALYPDRFAALANFSTPADPDVLTFTDFVFSRLSKEDIKARFGGESAQLKYLRSIDPVSLLPGISTPVLHYYPRYTRDSSSFNSGDRLRKSLGKKSPNHRFIQGAAFRTQDEFYNKWTPAGLAEWKRIHTELLAFLDRHVAKK